MSTMYRSERSNIFVSKPAGKSAVCILNLHQKQTKYSPVFVGSKQWLPLGIWPTCTSLPLLGFASGSKQFQVGHIPLRSTTVCCPWKQGRICSLVQPPLTPTTKVCWENGTLQKLYKLVKWHSGRHFQAQTDSGTKVRRVDFGPSWFMFDVQGREGQYFTNGTNEQVRFVSVKAEGAPPTIHPHDNVMKGQGGQPRGGQGCQPVGGCVRL